MVNPYVSVDCVLLGFDGEQLNVLVVNQSGKDGEDNMGQYKLPGSPIDMDEGLDEAAQRVLFQLTGLTQVQMRQFHAFGGTDRLSNLDDAAWLRRILHVDNKFECIVTIGYLSLLRIDRCFRKLEDNYEARWVPLSELPHLAFDHNEIVREAVQAVQWMAQMDPTYIFDLLPRKFTATQLRKLLQTVVGMPIDVKNFHKKLAQMPYVVPLDEKEEGVNHRAARYYKFVRNKKIKKKNG